MITYQEFLNTLISPISYFIDWITIVFNYFITNYFYITLIGISLISSLLIYFLSSIIINLNNSSKDLDNIHYSKN